MIPFSTMVSEKWVYNQRRNEMLRLILSWFYYELVWNLKHAVLLLHNVTMFDKVDTQYPKRIFQCFPFFHTSALRHWSCCNSFTLILYLTKFNASLLSLQYDTHVITHLKLAQICSRNFLFSIKVCCCQHMPALVKKITLWCQPVSITHWKHMWARPANSYRAP